AVRAVDPRARAGRAPGDVSAGADEAVPEGRALIAGRCGRQPDDDCVQALPGCLMIERCTHTGESTMRSLVFSLLIAACVMSGLAHARGTNQYVQVRAQPGTVAAGGTTTVKLQWPAGSYPVNYSFKSKHAGKVVELGA